MFEKNMDPKNTTKKKHLRKKKTGKLSTPATATENVGKWPAPKCPAPKNQYPTSLRDSPSGTLDRPPSLARPPFVRIVRIVQLTVPHVTPHRASYLGHGGGLTGNQPFNYLIKRTP